MPTSIFVSYYHRKDTDKKECLVRLLNKSPGLFRKDIENQFRDVVDQLKQPWTTITPRQEPPGRRDLSFSPMPSYLR